MSAPAHLHVIGRETDILGYLAVRISDGHARAVKGGQVIKE